jgi:hypothetical protein
MTARTQIVHTDRLGELERIIEQKIEGFIAVGQALVEIRESRLYKQHYSSFDEYCRERWQFTARHANRLIGGTVAAARLGPTGPTHESQVRPLLQLEPDERAGAWQEAVEAAPDGQPTAAQVDQVVRRRGAREALTSSESVDWYTPPEIIVGAHLVLGEIDLDPASCAEANEQVCAKRIYTVQQDGLTKPWKGRVWLNPPYGKNDDWESNQGIWSRRLIEQHEAGIARSALLLVNAATGNAWFEALWAYPICFPHRRLKFRAPRGTPKRDQPTQSSAIVYFGAEVRRFVDVFAGIGQCVIPCGALSEAV